QTNDIMLGRGILTIPNLANMIRTEQSALNWQQVMEILIHYATSSIDSAKPLYHSARIKQWLAYLKRHYVQASEVLQNIRTLKSQQEICQFLTNDNKNNT
ncbi:MAG: hypothetical protein J6577_07820, partial [Gilliamella sp.]|nr:hypothetical protein [Gilliamella sp.]